MIEKKETKSERTVWVRVNNEEYKKSGEEDLGGEQKKRNKEEQRNLNFQNGKLGCYSLKAIIPLLIFLWPIGMFLLIKRIIITKDFPKFRKNAVITMIVFILFITVGIFTLDDKEKEAYTATDKTALASQEDDQDKNQQDNVKEDEKKDSSVSDKEFKKKIRSPIVQDDIIELYNSELTEDQRKQLIEAVDNDKKSRLLEDAEEYNGHVERSIEDMILSLEFLDEIQSEEWSDLRSIQKAAKDYQKADNEISKLIDKYEDAQFVNTESVQNLAVYVLYKAKNSESYIFTDYVESGGSVIPANNWYGAVELKQAPSRAGVINITVASNGTFHYKTKDGFEGDIPQYKEVSASDIEYSDKYDEQDVIQENAISEIKSILGIK